MIHIGEIAMGVVRDMIFSRLEERFDALQEMMETQTHISDPDLVEAHITTITKYWSILNDADKDYIHAVKWAIEKQSEWNTSD